MHFIFPVLILVSQRPALFTTQLSKVLHSQPILRWLLLLDLSILCKKKDIGTDGGIPVLIEFTLMGGYLMKIYTSR